MQIHPGQMYPYLPANWPLWYIALLQQNADILRSDIPLPLLIKLSHTEPYYTLMPPICLLAPEHLHLLPAPSAPLTPLHPWWSQCPHSPQTPTSPTPHAPYTPRSPPMPLMPYTPAGPWASTLPASPLVHPWHPLHLMVPNTPTVPKHPNAPTPLGAHQCPLMSYTSAGPWAPTLPASPALHPWHPLHPHDSSPMVPNTPMLPTPLWAPQCPLQPMMGPNTLDGPNTPSAPTPLVFNYHHFATDCFHEYIKFTICHL